MNRPSQATTPPAVTRRVEVGDGHSLHVEQIGATDGVPALFLHGGPGSGCHSDHHRLFDPARFRAVFVDQRGAGRSLPKRGLHANTTQHLVADLELVRRALDIDRWLVVGGSWGALLALAYGQSHPERVAGLVLRAVFLGGAEDVDWAFRRGPQTLYPDLWRAFVGPLPKNERKDPIAAYGARLMSPDPAVHVPAARLWHDFEQTLSVLTPRNLDLPGSLEQAFKATSTPPNTPFFEWHYIRHGFFLDDGQLLAQAERLAGIPGIIVQGRYDLLCPPRGAEALARGWPDADLRMVEGAGHAQSEPGVRDAVVRAIDHLSAATG
jgi:proline iminopeptidase